MNSRARLARLVAALIVMPLLTVVSALVILGAIPESQSLLAYSVVTVVAIVALSWVRPLEPGVDRTAAVLFWTVLGASFVSGSMAFVVGAMTGDATGLWVSTGVQLVLVAGWTLFAAPRFGAKRSASA